MSYYKHQELIPENRESKIRETYIKCSKLEVENKKLKEILKKSIDILSETNGSLADCIYEIHEAKLNVSTDIDEIRFNKSSQFIKEVREVLNET